MVGRPLAQCAQLDRAGRRRSHPRTGCGTSPTSSAATPAAAPCTYWPWAAAIMRTFKRLDALRSPPAPDPRAATRSRSQTATAAHPGAITAAPKTTRRGPRERSKAPERLPANLTIRFTRRSRCSRDPNRSRDHPTTPTDES